MCVTPQRNLNLTAASSVNIQNSYKESLPSAVEGFWPQPSPNPADFSDSDRDEREEEEPLGFGVRPYMFELLSTAESAAEPAERERERKRGRERERRLRDGRFTSQSLITCPSLSLLNWVGTIAELIKKHCIVEPILSL